MKIHRDIAKALGYELIKRRKHPSSSTHLINLINHYEINLVLDVGANKGQFGNRLRKEGYRGEIHSFEPITSTFQQLLEATEKDHHWYAHQCAMGENVGEIVINIMESSDLSSILPPSDFGKEKYSKIKVLDKEAVLVNTIDQFLANNTAYTGRRILLKMDTQGYDLNVFKGARKSLKAIISLTSEISLTPIYNGMPHYLESLKAYEDSGFVISGIYPISRKDNMAVIEMDCMMLNNSLI